MYYYYILLFYMYYMYFIPFYSVMSAIKTVSYDLIFKKSINVNLE